MINLETPPDFLFAVSKNFLWRLVLILTVTPLLVFARKILLTIFLGVLLAVILDAATDSVRRVLHMSRRWAYTSILIASARSFAAVAYLLGPRIVTQVHELSSTVPRGVETLEVELGRYRWGKDLTKVFHSSTQPAKVANTAEAYARNVVTSLTTFIAIFAIALFLAANPGVYRGGALRLFPDDSRKKAAGLSEDLAFTMKWWMIGQLIPMATLGIGTMAGLWFLGIPLAFTLALLTAAMLFIPYVGSVIAYIPTALVAFTQGPEKVLFVTALYLGIHLAEGYVVTPLVQRRAVSLPPALTLTAQLFLWEFSGLLGVLAATPLAAVGLVLVQKLYLGERTSRNLER